MYFWANTIGGVFSLENVLHPTNVPVPFISFIILREQVHKGRESLEFFRLLRICNYPITLDLWRACWDLQLLRQFAPQVRRKRRLFDSHRVLGMTGYMQLLLLCWMLLAASWTRSNWSERTFPTNCQLPPILHPPFVLPLHGYIAFAFLLCSLRHVYD